MSDFGDGNWIKTRKPHRCEWCGQRIEVGANAYHYKGMYDGEWQDWRMHEECQDDYALNCDGEEFSPFDNERPAPPAEEK
jgi:hypothetical protein